MARPLPSPPALLHRLLDDVDAVLAEVEPIIFQLRSFANDAERVGGSSDGEEASRRKMQLAEDRSTIHQMVLRLGATRHSLLDYLDTAEHGLAEAPPATAEDGPTCEANLQALRAALTALDRRLDPFRRLRRHVWAALEGQEDQGRGGVGGRTGQQEQDTNRPGREGQEDQAAERAGEAGKQDGVGGPPFTVDLRDRNRPLLVRCGVAEVIPLEHAVFLQCLVEARGNWVDGRTIANELGGGTVRPDRIKKKLPKEVRSCIETSSGKGSRLITPTRSK